MTDTKNLTYRWTNASTEPGNLKGKLELICGGREKDVVLHLPDFAKARELLDYIEAVVNRAEKTAKREAAEEVYYNLTGNTKF